MPENGAYVEHLQDKVQALTFAGDALASAVSAVLGPDNDLIRVWDEAKRHGEVPRADGKDG